MPSKVQYSRLPLAMLVTCQNFDDASTYVISLPMGARAGPMHMYLISKNLGLMIAEAEMGTVALDSNIVI